METTAITSAQIIFPDKLTLDEKMAEIEKKIAELTATSEAAEVAEES
jgi:hypothetical protein